MGIGGAQQADHDLGPVTAMVPRVPERTGTDPTAGPILRSRWRSGHSTPTAGPGSKDRTAAHTGGPRCLFRVGCGIDGPVVLAQRRSRPSLGHDHIGSGPLAQAPFRGATNRLATMANTACSKASAPRSAPSSANHVSRPPPPRPPLPPPGPPQRPRHRHRPVPGAGGPPERPRCVPAAQTPATRSPHRGGPGSCARLWTRRGPTRPATSTHRPCRPSDVGLSSRTHAT